MRLPLQLHGLSRSSAAGKKLANLSGSTTHMQVRERHPRALDLKAPCIPQRPTDARVMFQRVCALAARQMYLVQPVPAGPDVVASRMTHCSHAGSERKRRAGAAGLKKLIQLFYRTIRAQGLYRKVCNSR